MKHIAHAVDVVKRHKSIHFYLKYVIYFPLKLIYLILSANCLLGLSAHVVN